MAGNDSGLTNSDIIAISSGIVALCAFFVSIFQTRYTVRHNKLQVRPLVTIESASDTGAKFIAIHNLGLGPALIRSVKATHLGLSYDLLTQQGLDALTNRIPGHDGESVNIVTNCLQRGSSIPANGCEKLVCVNLVPAAQHQHEDDIDAFIQALLVDVEYACIYDTVHKADNRTC